MAITFNTAFCPGPSEGVLFNRESVIDRTAGEEALAGESPGAAGSAVVGRFELTGG